MENRGKNNYYNDVKISIFLSKCVIYFVQVVINLSDLNVKEYQRFEDTKHTTDESMEFGMQENLQLVWNIRNGEISAK